MNGRILIIDDEPQMAQLLSRPLSRAGLEVEAFEDPEQGLQRLREHPFDVLLTDLYMPGMDGIEVLRRARVIRPGCEVVVMTANATVATAREALKLGAIDYLTKPFSVTNELLPAVESILEADAAAAEESQPAADSPAERAPSEKAPAETTSELLVGRSEAMRTAFERARKVARSRSPVLLLGESGTGKEVMADLIHRLGPRADRPLLRVNCAALSESLLESELFGHVRGAFTGATRDRDGIFAEADGGTLFLDEIGEMAPGLQPKLLRVLQEGEVRRVGDAAQVRHVDVRIIAATNRDMSVAIRNGSFREDLYYRLAVVPIELPPLRRHLQDLPDLLDHFLAQLDTPARFSDEALRALQGYGWPGNVRELSNAVEHAVVLGEGPVLGLADLPAAIQEAETVRVGAAQPDEEETLDAIERRTILQALERTGYNRTKAARVLGVTRRTLGYRIRKYELDDLIGPARAGEVSVQLPEKPGVRSVPPQPDSDAARVH